MSRRSSGNPPNDKLQSPTKVESTKDRGDQPDAPDSSDELLSPDQMDQDSTDAELDWSTIKKMLGHSESTQNQQRRIPGSRPARLDSFRTYIQSIPLLTPHEIYEKLSNYGYFGQDLARKSLALMAYRHVYRIKEIYLNGIKREELPMKTHYLMVGPTGCGKTYLIELLFRHILAIPTVIVDMTGFSETGYVGQDTPTILTRLIFQSDMDIAKASVGIVCLDEFDKIASSTNVAVFAGAGTTKDVTGLGVQRELLKLLEPGEVTVPLHLGHGTYDEPISFPNYDVAFVACGAFSGLKTISKIAGLGPSMGFLGQPQGYRNEEIAVNFVQEELERTSLFQQYGLLPELIGRFTRIVPLFPLSEETLLDILRNNLIKQYEEEFARHNLQLEVDAAVCQMIVRKCLKRETGARGLSSILLQYLEKAAFDAFSSKQARSVKLFMKTDQEVVVELI
jgi:ATP-dependent Clp protease ATP-binding subunit ClpX